MEKLLKSWFSYIKRQSFLSLIVSSSVFQGSIFIVLATLIPENFKLFFALTVILIFIFSLINKSIFRVLLTVFIILSQFQIPGKYYSFILIPPGHYSYEQQGIENGIVEGYGLIMTDFIAIWLLLSLFYNLLKSHQNHLGKIIRTHSLIILSNLIWMIFLILGLVSNSYYSFFPQFSNIVLFQHLKIVVMFNALLFSLRKNKEKTIYGLTHIFLLIILFQGVLGFRQMFLEYFSLGENTSFQTTYIVPDESRFSFRPYGSFAYANQYGYILSIIVLSFFLLKFIDTSKGNLNGIFLRKNESKLELILYLFMFLLLLFSQSRAVWLSLLIGTFLFRSILFRLIKSFLKSFKKHLLFLFAFFLVILLIILPRIMTSSQFLGKEGGGSLRLAMFTEGMFVLQNSPILGFGTETTVYQMFQQFPEGYIKGFPFAIHNAFLQTAIEQGIPGMVLFFAPLIILIIANRNQKNRNAKKIVDLSILNIFLYYSLHPSYGRVEFPFLGIILALIVYVNVDQKNISICE